MIHGEKVIVKAGDASGGGTIAVAVIANQRGMELTRTGEMREIASNDQDSQEFTAGRQGWSLTVSGLMSQRGDLLQVNVKYLVEIDWGDGTTESGLAWCSQVKATANIDTLVQQSAVFTGTGPLGAAASE